MLWGAKNLSHPPKLRLQAEQDFINPRYLRTAWGWFFGHSLSHQKAEMHVASSHLLLWIVKISNSVMVWFLEDTKNLPLTRNSFFDIIISDVYSVCGSGAVVALQDVFHVFWWCLIEFKTKLKKQNHIVFSRGRLSDLKSSDAEVRPTRDISPAFAGSWPKVC